VALQGPAGGDSRLTGSWRCIGCFGPMQTHQGHEAISLPKQFVAIESEGRPTSEVMNAAKRAGN